MSILSARMTAKTTVLWMIVIILFTTAIHVPFIRHADFVYDDELVIEANSMIRDISHVTYLFNERYYRYSGENTYRPLVTLTYFIDFALFGLSPAGFHATSVLLHMVCGLLLFFTILFWRKDRVAALLTMLLFLLHPANTEAMAAVSFREDILVAIFSLLTILSAMKAYQNGLKSNFWIWSALALIAAFLSKENTVFFIPWLACIFIIYAHKIDKKTILLQFGFLCIITLAFVLLWFVIMPSSMNLETTEQPLLNRIAAAPAIVAFHIETVLLPVHLSVEHPEQVFSWVDLMVLTGVLLIFLNTLKNRQPELIGLLWFIAALTPLLNIYPQIAVPVAERYLYLPLAGVAASMGIFLSRLFSLSGKTSIKISAFILLICLLGFWVFIRINRLDEWSTDKKLWESALEIAPQSPRAHLNYAGVYFKNGQNDRAMKILEKARKLAPDEAVILMNMGHIKKDNLDFKAAEEFYRQAIAVDNTCGICYFQLGILKMQHHHFSEAVQLFETALEYLPGAEKIERALFHAKLQAAQSSKYRNAQ